MTYKTRQEVLRAAVNWMDVCEAAGIDVAVGKYAGDKDVLENMAFDGAPEQYEFPLVLLEGKEVWIGSELYWDDGRKATVTEGWNSKANWELLSWNLPKPKTVMVTLSREDAEAFASVYSNDVLVSVNARIARDFRNALENLSGCGGT